MCLSASFRSETSLQCATSIFQITGMRFDSPAHMECIMPGLSYCGFVSSSGKLPALCHYLASCPADLAFIQSPRELNWLIWRFMILSAHRCAVWWLIAAHPTQKKWIMELKHEAKMRSLPKHGGWVQSGKVFVDCCVLPAVHNGMEEGESWDDELGAKSWLD